MMPVVARSLFIFGLIAAGMVNAAQKECTIAFDAGFKFAMPITECIPEPIVVKRFEGSSNNGTSSDEIAYLLGIVIDEPITVESFRTGLERLQQKNVFSSVHVVFDYQPDGVALKVTAEAFWTIKSIKVKGVSLGKQSIVYVYQLRVGERFSKDKHEISLEEIVKDLHKKGYWDASVNAFFDYDLDTKSIHITLVVVKGPLYFIDDVRFKIVSDANDEEQKKIHELLYKTASRYLVYRPYCENSVKKKVQLLQNLLISQGFVYVKVSYDSTIIKEKKTVIITLTIRFDRYQKVNFMGNRFFTSSFLIDSVMQCTHAIGIVPSIILAEEMMDIYRAKGFLASKIETAEDVQNYYFMIHEGMRSTIDAVHIRGSSFVSSSYLVRHFFKNLVHAYTDEKKSKAAFQACIAWYKNQGFWDAQFLKKEYAPTTKSSAFLLTCVIDEGRQRIFKDVIVEGFPEYTKDLLTPDSPLWKKNIPLSELLLSQQKEILEKECKKYGYNNPRIAYELIEDDSGACRVLWKVITGERMVFGKTIVKGAAIDHSKVLHLLPYKEGDVWSKERIHELYRTFHTIGVYKSIAVQQNFIHGQQEACDVILTLEEDDPFEVKLRVGFQQISKNFAFRKGSSYKIGGGFVWKNPFSRLDSFVVDSSITLFERRTSVAYKQPLFLNIPLETVIKGYSNAYMNPVSLGSRKILYEALQDGLLVGFSSKRDGYDVGITSGVEWMKIKNISEGLSLALRFVPELINERVPYWFFEPTFYMNRLDDNVNPHKGFFLFGSAKTMVPFDARATASVKFLIEHGLYGSWHDVVGAFRLRFGHILLQDFTSIMPPERFYLGGANSLRGYQPDKCPPLGSFVDEDKHTQWVAQGGKSMVNANFELRFPLPIQNLQGALFQDFGILAPDLHTVFHTFSPLAATGFGVRYITPFGPLRFDIGWKWKKQYEQDTSYAWFLTFGYAF